MKLLVTSTFSSSEEDTQACRLFLSFFLLIISGIICTQAAAELLKVGVAFTLVDPKEYFHHCVGALRAAVNPGNFLDQHISSQSSHYYSEYTPKTAIPFREAFGDSFVQGSVVSLDLENHKAMLEGGTKFFLTHLFSLRFGALPFSLACPRP